METAYLVRHLQRLEGLTSFFLRRLSGYARLICYVATISALALKAHIESMASICLLPATNVTAPAIPALCIEADFDHTFFVDDSDLTIIQPLDQHPQTGELVKIARWDDADPPHLVAHTPEETRRRTDVRFGSKADIERSLADVRFTPKAGIG